MTDQPIFITDDDLSRLRSLLGTKGELRGEKKRHLRELRNELDRAIAVSDGKIGTSVITMNSKFRLKDLDTGHEAEYVLCYPGEADINRGKLSVLAPIGTALLGYKELDVVAWHVPAGLKRFRIEQILYQPQAATKALGMT